MTDVLSLRNRGVFVAWVLAIYAVARVVTTTVLLLVMQHQVPSGMTGGDDVPRCGPGPRPSDTSRGACAPSQMAKRCFSRRNGRTQGFARSATAFAASTPSG